jgi:hypothetical protein
VQLAFARRQKAHGCVPLHLIFLLKEKLENRTWTNTEGISYFLHLSQALVTLTLSFRPFFLGTGDLLSTDANGIFIDAISSKSYKQYNGKAFNGWKDGSWGRSRNAEKRSQPSFSVWGLVGASFP